MMWRLIRDTHLVLGMSGFLFVLLYAVSAAQMAHRIRLTPQVSEEDVVLPAGLEARPLAAALMEQRGYGGELGNPQMTPNGFRVTITRPGTNYVVSYDRTTGRARVRRETRSFLGMLNRLHHQNGLHHADGRLNAWGWALALVSLALLALGVTGVCLWFRLRRERVIGTVLLAGNLAVSLALLVALRF
jgi:hypothetical protein